MNKAGKLFLNTWRWINTLSLDVCTGAIAGGIMATMVLGTDPGWAYWLILPVAVWMIYTTDHLIDAHRAGTNAQHSRRITHRENRKTLMLIIGILLPAIAIIAFLFLPQKVIIFGLALGILVLIYLSMILFIGKRSAPLLPKELFVAIFYSSGIWGPLFLINTGIPEMEIIIVFIMFFMLVFEDLLLLSYLESMQDQKEGQSSLALVMGSEKLRVIISLAAITVLSVTMWLMITETNIVRKASVILFCMQLSLILIYLFAKPLRKNDLYRYLSEAVFFVPALIVF